LDIDRIGPRISFFFAAHNDLFEEVAKFRAARRLWAKLVRERYQGNDRSCFLRFHTQTGGCTLTAQQPLNNVVRVTVQALAAVLGGTQSLHTNSYDEALALPSEESAKLALRTQQLVAYESGAAQTVDPLGGSYYVESLTNQIEKDVLVLLAEIEELGGASKAIDAGFFQDAIGKSAYAYQRAMEAGEIAVVGVNQFTDDEATAVVPRPDYSALADRQQELLAEARNNRDETTVRASLDALAVAAQSGGDEGLMPLVVDAVRVRGTVGEISDTLRSVWGTFRASG
jgi:methylmalonyl-CoA mutase N-terminal domain/subunit